MASHDLLWLLNHSWAFFVVEIEKKQVLFIEYILSQDFRPEPYEIVPFILYISQQLLSFVIQLPLHSCHQLIIILHSCLWRQIM